MYNQAATVNLLQTIRAALRDASPTELKRHANKFYGLARELEAQADQVLRERDRKSAAIRRADILDQAGRHALARIAAATDTQTAMSETAQAFNLSLEAVAIAIKNARRKVRAERLEQRRRRAARLAAMGMTNKEIAQTLGVSPATVAVDMRKLREARQSMHGPRSIGRA